MRRMKRIGSPGGMTNVVFPAAEAPSMWPVSFSRRDRIDARTAASVYRALRGPLTAAYRALGYADRSFDRSTAKALNRVERAPVRDDGARRSRGQSGHVDKQ
jgi:hypothetical protein